jgi:hypothetical protein
MRLSRLPDDNKSGVSHLHFSLDHEMHFMQLPAAKESRKSDWWRAKAVLSMSHMEAGITILDIILNRIDEQMIGFSDDMRSLRSSKS